MSNIYFTQAISNPFDVMSSLCFLTSGGVCERFPELKLIFLEANGGLARAMARASGPPHRRSFRGTSPG